MIHKTRLFRPSLLAVLMSAAPLLGLQAQEAGGNPPRPAHEPPPSPLFDALDTNHDGVISADEIANASSALKALLKNGATQLTRDDVRPPRPAAPRDQAEREDGPASHPHPGGDFFHPHHPSPADGAGMNEDAPPRPRDEGDRADHPPRRPFDEGEHGDRPMRHRFDESDREDRPSRHSHDEEDRGDRLMRHRFDESDRADRPSRHSHDDEDRGDRPMHRPFDGDDRGNRPMHRPPHGPEDLQGANDHGRGGPRGDDAERPGHADDEMGRPHHHSGPLFDALDSNRDGVISADEIAKAPDTLKKLEKGGSDKITRDDLRAMPPPPKED